MYDHTYSNKFWHVFCLGNGMTYSRLKLLRYLVFGVIVIFIYSCSQVNKVTDFMTNPSAKELYEREFKDAPERYALWEQQAQIALLDSVAVSLPYSEAGAFRPGNLSTYSYDLVLNPGEKFLAVIQPQDTSTRVFIDLYRKLEDSLTTYEHLESAKPGSTSFRTEVSEPGIYKILIQPEIAANSKFQLHLYSEPVYVFPVADGNNQSIQSFWGAVRDGGRRSHEGVDIFAPRGTPVVAATKGYVTSTGDKGLGGKQVWLRDQNRGVSLYYAHLDSIMARQGMRVQPGDTLGLVGNTGNARTTPPHLHFGVYKGYRGAINPLPFVYQTKQPEILSFEKEEISDQLLVRVSAGNLRSGPTTSSTILGRIQAQDTLKHLGKTTGWHHIQKDNKKAFIHENLVRVLP